MAAANEFSGPLETSTLDQARALVSRVRPSLLAFNLGPGDWRVFCASDRAPSLTKGCSGFLVSDLSREAPLQTLAESDGNGEETIVGQQYDDISRAVNQRCAMAALRQVCFDLTAYLLGDFPVDVVGDRARGRLMWARVKGRTENALLQMRFKAVYLFRPAYIQPLYGARTKTAWYAAFYAVVRPFYPLLKTLLPNYVTTTECVGRAMLNITKRGFAKPVLE